VLRVYKRGQILNLNAFKESGSFSKLIEAGKLGTWFRANEEGFPEVGNSLEILCKKCS